MIERARAKLSGELARRVRFTCADASALPFADGELDLVTLANAIPFWDELARVAAPGGTVRFSFSSGPATPIWVAPERLRHELARRGFERFEEVRAGRGITVLATKPKAR
jgi:ubiquinone/menaquinone biosynthesis C-methylase UbiE